MELQAVFYIIFNLLHLTSLFEIIKKFAPQLLVLSLFSLKWEGDQNDLRLMLLNNHTPQIRKRNHFYLIKFDTTFRGNLSN